MDLLNSTPLIASHNILTDRNGAETLLVVVKGTWRIGRNGALSIAGEQVPIQLEPRYLGDPAASSLIYDTDLILEKPGTDCILLGYAWAPKVGVGSVDVTFGVGPLRKTVRVFGERIWMKCLGMVSMSKPAPFEKIPLVWERAFGGSDTSWPEPKEHEFCLENPVGTGLLARKTKLEIDGLRLPNLEDPAHLIKKPTDRPKPVGFGPIPPHWFPRAGYAGTYDDQWRKYVSPLPPDDLDPRFYLAAAPGLTTARHLAGTEQVLVENASRAGRLQFQLPGGTPSVSVQIRAAVLELEMRLGTVIVEPDEERLVLVWRGHQNVHGKIHDVYGVRVGYGGL
ncbi:Protein of unknown function DUF2169 [Geobacter metallireducens RCH3]|uniref:DUF2169 domain-containing protein n=1 Tax=Geobacter metallireducens (strain ATCC 53774 / DSM 7210 / GS-15) TaxID=269799 RepID=Q39YY8_GEOMG|nr:MULTISPECIES: DUF2169 domain-containing protein [Geobacter]ABB30536.1 protein of unknown function DUF2169 [Geobacter metallireducens GS-15]EHP85210.1 Protein of unknown function DUF2169 [Geobacter metallireducens RCH3]MBT1076333.1 DUF2169 domain-containing protein [Geobacter grbiciae]